MLQIPKNKKNKNVYCLDENLLHLVDGKQGRKKAGQEQHKKFVFLSYLAGWAG